MAAKKRDFRAEYLATQGTKKGKLDRAARNRARAKAMKAGRVKKGDGKDVDHKNFNPRDNSPGNTRVISSSANKRRQPKRK